MNKLRALAMAGVMTLPVATTAVVMTEAPASATVWCNSNQMTSIRQPYYVGNGVWRAEILCGPLMSAPRTNMGNGGNITDVQLCQMILGTCAKSVCYTYGGKYCQAYTDGDKLLQSRARRNGVQFYSPAFHN